MSTKPPKRKRYACIEKSDEELVIGLSHSPPGGNRTWGCLPAMTLQEALDLAAAINAHASNVMAGEEVRDKDGWEGEIGQG